MSQAFTYDALPGRVVFGSGSLAKLPEQLDALGLKRAMVLTTPPQADSGQKLVDLIGARGRALYQSPNACPGRRRR